MTASVTPAWLEPLLQRLAAETPERGLLVCPTGHPLTALLPSRLPRTALTLRDTVTASAPGGQRHDFALVADTLERIGPDAARRLLAALRDLMAGHVLVWADTGRSALSAQDLRTLGFRLHARDGTHVLFGFDLYDYKDRPDWLNSRYWAHPERWDKDRW